MIVVLGGALIWACVRMLAQVPQSKMPPDADLPRVVTQLDREVFDAYNHCGLQRLGTFFVDDVEFYDDRDGLSVGKQNLIDAVGKYICGKVRRELVANTLEVHPLHNYGAVEIGVHRFRHPGADAREPGEARFIHLWAFRNGTWKISRVVSFAHNSVSK